MGNGSSKYSSRHYDYRPFTGPVIPPPSQMAHADSNATTGSTFPSYDRPRRKRKWYQFSTGRDRHRGQDVWYSAYVSPGQQPPPLNVYGVYQRPPDRQRNPSMPVPMTTQYGSLYIPEGYIPSTVNPPVVPQDAPMPMPDPGNWRVPTHSPHHNRDHSQGHYRRPSQPYPPVQPVEPAVIPSRPFTEGTTSTSTSVTAASPPFKPFEPLPAIRRSKPPAPPPKMLDLSPYRETLAHLSNPSPVTRSKALEIVNNKDKTNITRAHEEWRRQDEEREKVIKEKREQRERLVSGANTIQAPTMQTVTALVVDQATIQQPFVPPPLPPPPPPPKEKKPFWRKFFHPGGKPPEHTVRQVVPVTTMPIPTMGGPVMIPLGAQQALHSVPGVVVPVQILSQSQTQSSSSPTQQSSSQFPEPNPAPPVIPVSPSRRYTGGVIPDGVGPPATMPTPSVRSPTTPKDRPTPTAAFFPVPGTPNV